VPRFAPIKVIGEEAFLVESETTYGKYYRVNMEDGKCECAVSHYRGQVCKHAYSILRREKAY
jgi:hypothetical protein